MERIRLTAIFFAIVFTACGGPKSMLAPSLKEGTYRVAVLNFSSTGFLGSQKLGKFTADALADALVLKKKAHVIDRAVVNAAVGSNGISAGHFIPQKQLHSFANSLNADLVMMGSVHNIVRILDRFTETAPHIMLTCRIVEPESGRVLGVISHETRSHKAEEQAVKAMIDEVVEAMSGLKIRKES